MTHDVISNVILPTLVGYVKLPDIRIPYWNNCPGPDFSGLFEK